MLVFQRAALPMPKLYKRHDRNQQKTQRKRLVIPTIISTTTTLKMKTNSTTTTTTTTTTTKINKSNKLNINEIIEER